MTDCAEQLEADGNRNEDEGRELRDELGEQKILKNKVQVEMMRAKKELAKEKESYEALKKKLEDLLRANPPPSLEEKQEIMMTLEDLKRQKAANQEMEERLQKGFEELSHYNLEDPEQFADFLIMANIGLVRAEYLYKLRQTGQKLPRRQEADFERCGADDAKPALVGHDEAKKWAKDTKKAIICSVSHAWETREHPDPCGFQLEQIVNAVSLYDVAYDAEIWVFYDYSSLYQYQRQGEDQLDSFDLSMQNMHLLYAHDATYTFRINSLTPDDRWASMMEAPDQVVNVYDEASNAVIPKPLRELVPNRTPYEDRGWCMAEIEWSSVRSRSWQHQRIDSSEESEDQRTLQGRVPMTPEAFEDRMREAAFTHRSDATQVILLQKKVFHEKVENCEGAVLQNLPQGELGKLAESLKYYAKLKNLKVLNFECSEDEATSFGKALAEHMAQWNSLKTLRIQNGQNGDFIVKALAEGLKHNLTLTNLILFQNKIGPEGAQALAEGLKNNSTLTNLDLNFNNIGPEGAQALAEGLKHNSTLTNLNLYGNNIGDTGAQAEQQIEETLLRNQKMVQVPTERQQEGQRFTLQDGNLATPRIQELAEGLKNNSILTKLNLYNNNIGDTGAQGLAEMLKHNSTLTDLYLGCNNIGPEGAQALAEGLKHNSTLTNLSLYFNKLGDTGAQGFAEMLKHNSALTNLKLEGNIADTGAQALAEGLKHNSTLTHLSLNGNKIGDTLAQALAKGLKDNSTLTNLN
eukprot:symbB.v1.2.032890.t1/scaffold4013.1/size46388/1